MSTRLHYAKTYAVEYGERSAFSHAEDAVCRILFDHDCTVYRTDESPYTEYFDVPRGDIARLVGELVEARQRGEEEERGVRIDDLVDFFGDALQHAEPDDSDIHFAWF